MAIPATIGSSGSSAVLAELIHGGCAPKAILLQSIDAILIVGVLVAQEMGWPAPLAAEVAFAELPEEGNVVVAADGNVSWST